MIIHEAFSLKATNTQLKTEANHWIPAHHQSLAQMPVEAHHQSLAQVLGQAHHQNLAAPVPVQANHQAPSRRGCRPIFSIRFWCRCRPIVRIWPRCCRRGGRPLRLINLLNQGRGNKWNWTGIRRVDDGSLQYAWEWPRRIGNGRKVDA